MNPIKISQEYDKMMKMINEVRSDLFDCVEIPHLKNYYEGEDQSLTFSADLFLVREAEKYISQNLCPQYSIDTSRKVCEHIKNLLNIQKQFERLNQAILKQSSFSHEAKQLSQKDRDSHLNTVVVQNAVIEEYFYSKPSISST